MTNFRKGAGSGPGWNTNTGLSCPMESCQENPPREGSAIADLYVENRDVYYGGDDYEARCEACGARFSVTAIMSDVEFTHPVRLADGEMVS